MANVISLFENVESLNANERLVLDACIDVALRYGEGPYFVFDEVRVPNLTTNQIKGYISDLKKKGFVEPLPRGEFYFDMTFNVSYTDWQNLV